jgi:hypothetical protein
MARHRPTAGLVVDTHNVRFQHGKDDAFKAWWRDQAYHPNALDKEYVQGYAFGWEMASDPLHEDGHDPHLDPMLLLG